MQAVRSLPLSLRPSSLLLLPTRPSLVFMTHVSEGQGRKEEASQPPPPSEVAPIKCDGRESAGLPTLSISESVGLPALSIRESVSLPADSLPAHFIGAASGFKCNKMCTSHYGLCD